MNRAFEALSTLLPVAMADSIDAWEDRKPVVHASVPIDRAADAHRQLEAGGVVGKLLLEVPAG